MKRKYNIGEVYGNHLMCVKIVGQPEVNGEPGYTIERYVKRDFNYIKDKPLFASDVFMTEYEIDHLMKISWEKKDISVLELNEE